MKIQNLQSNKLVDAARELLKAFGYFMDRIWHIDDVHFICEQLELGHLDDSEAWQVFQIAGEMYEGDNGLSWPVLERAVHIYLQRKRAIHNICETAPA